MADNIFAELVEIQNKVRDYFGWDYQDDFLSATSISQEFNSPAPFNITNWSQKPPSKFSALKEKLLAASKVVIVGASVKEMILLISILKIVLLLPPMVLLAVLLGW